MAAYGSGVSNGQCGWQMVWRNVAMVDISDSNGAAVS